MRAEPGGLVRRLTLETDRTAEQHRQGHFPNDHPLRCDHGRTLATLVGDTARLATVQLAQKNFEQVCIPLIGGRQLLLVLLFR